MKVRTPRRALVAVATLAMAAASTFATAPAEALGSCVAPLPLNHAGAGVLSPVNPSDYWLYARTGTTHIEVTGPSPIRVEVFDHGCGSLLCYGACTITHSGFLTVFVYNVTGPYVVTATPAAPGQPPECDAGHATLCVEVTRGGLAEEHAVYEVEPFVSPDETADAYIDEYRFPSPGGGTVRVDCLVVWATGKWVDPCRLAGGTFERRVSWLHHAEYDRPAARLGDPAVTVRVCHANYRVWTVGGAHDVNGAYALC